MKISKSKLSILMAQNNINFIRLAESSGVSRTTLSYINNGKSCRPEVVSKIANALNTNITELIEN